MASFHCDQRPFAAEKTQVKKVYGGAGEGTRDKTISSSVKAGITLLVGVSTGETQCSPSRTNTR